MELFRADGHLTDEALTALIREEPLGELERLEMAEHLAFCDWCLQRYTGALEGAALRAPQRSCRETLWRRIRTRTWQLITSRYATAAAAVALALTLVWSGERIPIHQQPPAEPSAAAALLREWPERWGRSLDHMMRRAADLLDPTQLFDSIQGGN